MASKLGRSQIVREDSRVFFPPTPGCSLINHVGFVKQPKISPPVYPPPLAYVEAWQD